MSQQKLSVDSADFENKKIILFYCESFHKLSFTHGMAVSNLSSDNLENLDVLNAGISRLYEESSSNEKVYILISHPLKSDQINTLNLWIIQNLINDRYERLKFIVVVRKSDLYLLQEDYRESFIPVIDNVYREDSLKEVEVPLLTMAEIEKEISGDELNKDIYMRYIKGIQGLGEVLAYRHFLDIYLEKLPRWIEILRTKDLDIKEGEEVKSGCVISICRALLNAWYESLAKEECGQGELNADRVLLYRELSEEVAWAMSEFGGSLSREQMLDCIEQGRDKDLIRRCLGGVPLKLKEIKDNKYEFRIQATLLMNFLVNERRNRIKKGAELRLFENPLEILNVKDKENEWLDDELNRVLLAKDELETYAERLRKETQEAGKLREKMLGWVYRTRKGEAYSIGGRNAFTMLNYSRFNFSGQNFSRINASNSDLSEAKLENTDLSHSSLKHLKLRDAYCAGAVFCESDLEGLDLGEFPRLPGHGKTSMMKWDNVHHRLYCVTEINVGQYGIQVLILDDIFTQNLPNTFFWSSQQEIVAMDFNIVSDELIYVTQTDMNRLVKCSTKYRYGILTGMNFFEEDDSAVAVKLSADSKILAVATSTTVTVLIQEADIQNTKEVQEATVIDIDLSNDGRYVCVVDDSGRFTVFSIPEMVESHSADFVSYDLPQVLFLKDGFRIGILGVSKGEKTRSNHIFLYDLRDDSVVKHKLRYEPIKFCCHPEIEKIFVIYHNNVVEGINIANGSVFYRHKIPLGRDFKLSDVICITQNNQLILLISSTYGNIYRLHVEERQYRYDDLFTSYTVLVIPQLGCIASLRADQNETNYVSLARISDGKEVKKVELDFSPECITYDPTANTLLVGGEHKDYDDEQYLRYMLNRQDGAFTPLDDPTIHSGLVRVIDLRDLLAQKIRDISFPVCAKYVTVNNAGMMSVVTRENLVWSRMSGRDNFIKLFLGVAVNTCCFYYDEPKLLIGANEGIILYDINSNQILDRIDTEESVVSLGISSVKRRVVINTAPANQCLNNSFSTFKIKDDKIHFKKIFIYRGRGELRTVLFDDQNSLFVTGDDRGNLCFWRDGGMVTKRNNYSVITRPDAAYELTERIDSIESLVISEAKLIVYDNYNEAITVWRVKKNSNNDIYLEIEWTSQLPTLVLKDADFKGAMGLDRNKRAVLSQFTFKVDLPTPPVEQITEPYESEYLDEYVNDYMQQQILMDSQDENDDGSIEDIEGEMGFF